MKGVVIAGTHSGCGKTTVTLGILAALRKKNRTVQPFKAGPDFIDAGLHGTITGRTSRNLDPWMCGGDYVEDLYLRHAADADIAVVEGVMGLYDGSMSTAALSVMLGLPVILVVDGYGMAESAGAVVRGFVEFRVRSQELRRRDSAVDGQQSKLITRDSKVSFAGVIFNRVGSERHYARLKESVQDVPVLGYLPRNLDFTIPHRHLGLMVAEENPLEPREIEKLADAVLENVDIEAIMKGAGLPAGQAGVRGRRSGFQKPVLETEKGLKHAGLKIGIAYDRAFCFYYEDNIDYLRAAGAVIVKFSPLTDSALPEGLDALYLGGGYPELYAGDLSRNRSMLDSIKTYCDRGAPVYAECGGFLYLTEGIYDFNNAFHQLAGVFPFKTVMKKGRAHLGYREITLKKDSIIGTQGTVIRGHEFHYSEIVNKGQEEIRGQDPELIYSVKDGSGGELGKEGYTVKNTLGSYVHVHFGSNRSIVNHFIQHIKEHHGMYSSGRAR